MPGTNRNITIGNQTLDLSTPAVMAIINITPDSFWKGSRQDTPEGIAGAIGKAISEGADLLDIGGYSSRPGADDVPAGEEYRRLSKAMELVRDVAPDAIVSLDTFRADVARSIIQTYGPCIINDISAGTLDGRMVGTAAELGVPYIAMHMRSTPGDMQNHTEYTDVVGDVEEFFEHKVGELRAAGIRDIILDPGFGFAKTTEQNYILMAGMHKLAGLGYPILSGISRKSMIYKVLGTTPAGALTGTTALNWESLRQGASIIRVHDVREAVETVKLFNFYNTANKTEQK